MKHITKKELKEKLGIRLNKNEPKEILFFTGAGISSPDPCAFPQGNELHKILLQNYTDLTNWEVDKFLNEDSIFEKTVSTIINAYGLPNTHNRPFNLLGNIFIYNRDNTLGRQNDYHKFFREHIIKGGKHFTVNLDQFIELDGKEKITLVTNDDINNNEIEDTDNGFLYKIHNDVIFNESGAQGFLFEVIKCGFKKETKTFFDTHINKTKAVIFVGYGGVDKFDVTRYFKEKPAGFFSNTKALWINYSKDNQISISENSNEDQKTILSKFGNYLAVECSPDLILNNLFNDVPRIQNAHRSNGYRKEFEEFFKSSIMREVLDNINGLEEKQITEQVTNYWERRRRIREHLLVKL